MYSRSQTCLQLAAAALGICRGFLAGPVRRGGLSLSHRDGGRNCSAQTGFEPGAAARRGKFVAARLRVPPVKGWRGTVSFPLYGLWGATPESASERQKWAIGGIRSRDLLTV